MNGGAKGALAVGQSGGPTAVTNATLVEIVREAPAYAEVGRILGLVHGIEGALAQEMIDLRQQDPSVLEYVARTPAAALGSSRYKVREEDCERVLEVFRAHEVRYLLLVGGNDSMDTCHRIARMAAREGYELAVVGVPKTIDNDLPGTDHCPGYGSAARFIALATMDAGMDLEAMRTFDDVSILETMGRNTGWLAAASALGRRAPSDPPHLIYVPERPFDEAQFMETVQRVHDANGHVFCVVAEGLRDRHGQFVGLVPETVQTDVFGHKLVTLTSGVGQYLAARIREVLCLQARCSRPGTLQRSAGTTISCTDLEEAKMVGRAAVQHAVRGVSDVMVALRRVSNNPYRSEPGIAPLACVANRERFLADAWIEPDNTGMTSEFLEYALPLIGDPLPEYGRLRCVRVPKRTA